MSLFVEIVCILFTFERKLKRRKQSKSILLLLIKRASPGDIKVKNNNNRDCIRTYFDVHCVAGTGAKQQAAEAERCW